MTYEKQESVNNFWKAEKENDQIEGLVLDIKTHDEYGKSYVLNVDGEEVTTPSHRVLQNLMANAKVGDKVKIVYLKTELPTVKGKNGTMMYDVFIDNGQPEKLTVKTR